MLIVTFRVVMLGGVSAIFLETVRSPLSGLRLNKVWSVTILLQSSSVALARDGRRKSKEE
jgi:hypothetical protein